MSKHKRRPDYWKYYHVAHVRESPFLIGAIADLVRKHPSPRPNTNRGRPPVHSHEKMDFVCVLTVARNVSLRDMESDLHTMKNPWDGEPVGRRTRAGSHYDMDPS